MPTRHSTFLVQSTHGGVGNFELLVPRPAGGGAAHFWRDNDAPLLPWTATGLAFGSPDDVYALSLIQGNLGAVGGNLEVVALEGSQLVHHWRDDGGSWRWQARTVLPGSVPVVNDVAMVHSSHGAGNYEVVAPVAAAGGGGLAHWYRDNGAAGYPWQPPTFFGSGGVDAVAMLQSTFGPAGNLELVARAGGQLWHYYRDDGATWAWSDPAVVPGTQGVSGKHVLLQRGHGGGGNFELVSPMAGGGLGHWWRDNDDPLLTWHGPTSFGFGSVDAVAMVQSNFGGGNLEVVACMGTEIVHYWHNAETNEWVGPLLVYDAAPPDPSVAGASSVAYAPPMVAIHAAVARTGKLAMWGNQDFDANAGIEATLDLETGASQFPSHHHHLFCSGHAALPDGAS